MAEEDTNENVEQAPEGAQPEAEVAPVQSAAPAAQTPAAPAAHAAHASAEPAEVVPPKERRRRARTAKAAKAPARAARTSAERHEDRVTERRRKAAVRRVERQRARAKASAPAQTSEQAPREHAPGAPKTRRGVVVSDRAEKTITVRVDTARRHRRYDKIVRTSRTLHAHDERGEAHIGDTVVVRECRPLSRTKRWRLVEVVERAR